MPQSYLVSTVARELRAVNRILLELSTSLRTSFFLLAAEELFEEEAGEAAGVVAEDAVFLEEIVEDDAEAELLEGGKIDGHRFGALGAVASCFDGREGLAICDVPIDDAVRHVSGEVTAPIA